ncbi:Hint domain-containing protein [Yoonia algicola]|uniref:Hint domain-containing protein n=1 Tax=Yoonia algicola TaxID=3137368 RepID=A0AAN0NIR1_9RHOB
MSGTERMTPQGRVAIEDLRVGDLVLTRDHGAHHGACPAGTTAAPRLNASCNQAPISLTPLGRLQEAPDGRSETKIPWLDCRCCR